MADNTTATGAGPNTGLAEGSPAPEGTPNPQTVSVEEFAALKRQNDWLAKQVRELATAKQPTPAKSDEPATLKERLDKVEATLATERAMNAAGKQKFALLQAVSASGVDADNAELLLDHIQVRHSANIKLGEDGEPIYDDPETGDRKSIKDFVAGLLKGPRGDRFRTAKPSGPNSKSLRGGGNRPTSSAPDFNDLSLEDRLALRNKSQSEYLRSMSSSAKKES